MKTITDPNHWDCECDYDYIHPKSTIIGMIYQCKQCMTNEQEQPDSRLIELEGMSKTNQSPTVAKLKFTTMRTYNLEQELFLILSKVREDDGWTIGFCYGDGDPTWQLQYLDDVHRFDCDEEAWKHVWWMAEDMPDSIHAEALKWLKANEPKEYEIIEKYIKRKP